MPIPGHRDALPGAEILEALARWAGYLGDFRIHGSVSTASVAGRTREYLDMLLSF